MASICSVTFIEPSSLAMPDELRPATISAGQHRTQFANQGQGNERARLADLPVRRERARHLQRHHGAREEADDTWQITRLPTPIVSICRNMSSE